MPDNQMMSTIVMLALMGLAFWFLLIRPAQKKQKDQQNMVAQLTPGARVMTTAGVFATIVQVGGKQVVIEIAPGVEMTVLKQAILRVVDPAEDEFEYDPDGDADIVDQDALVESAPGDTFLDHPFDSTRPDVGSAQPDVEPGAPGAGPRPQSN